jgi:hypothetical protein
LGAPWLRRLSGTGAWNDGGLMVDSNGDIIEQLQNLGLQRNKKKAERGEHSFVNGTDPQLIWKSFARQALGMVIDD